MKSYKISSTQVTLENYTYSYHDVSLLDAKKIIEEYEGQPIESIENEEDVFILNNGKIIRIFLDMEGTIFDSIEDYYIDQSDVIKKIKVGDIIKKIALDKEGKHYNYKQVNENIFDLELNKNTVIEERSVPGKIIYTTDAQIFLQDVTCSKYFIFPSKDVYDLYHTNNNGTSIFNGIIEFNESFPTRAKSIAKDMLDRFELDLLFNEKSLYQLEEYIRQVELDDKFYYKNICSLVAYVGEVYINEFNWEWKMINKDEVWYPYLINEKEELIHFFLNVSNTINPDYPEFSSLYGAFIAAKMRKTNN